MTAVGTAMIAAQADSLRTIWLSRASASDSPVSKIAVTVSRRLSTHSLARTTWSDTSRKCSASSTGTGSWCRIMESSISRIGTTTLRTPVMDRRSSYVERCTSMDFGCSSKSDSSTSSTRSSSCWIASRWPSTTTSSSP